MPSFFRFLEKERVRFLLISGQACVLYGASQFTEDIDLWIQPSAPNLQAFLRALVRSHAVVHKHTPPLTVHNLRRGHGFHFLLPPDVYLDVMGCPPRVDGFESASRRARILPTDWGHLPVVAPEDLVLLKRTNRPGDYEAISNLVRLRWEEDPQDRKILAWALENSFDLEDLRAFWSESGVRRSMRFRRPVLRGLREGSRRTRLLELLALEMARHQERGRRYWIPLLRELKRLRFRGELIPPGTPVSTLIPTQFRGTEAPGSGASRGGRHGSTGKRAFPRGSRPG